MSPASGNSAADARRRRWPLPERGSGPAFALSLLAHAMLFIAIAFVVRWKTEAPGTVSAEVWSAPPVVEAPAPRPAPVVPVPPPPPPRVEPEPPKADIVVAPKKIAPVIPPRPVPPPDPPRKEEKKAPPPDLEAAARRDAAEKATQAKAAEAQRQAAISRALASAGPSVPAASAGAGMSRGYEAQIIGCIRPHIVFNVPEGLRTQQHVAEFEVQLLPTGEQAAAPRLLKSSGLAPYDQAVERAIRRCDPFPRPREGTMPRSLRLSFDPIETR